MLRPHDRGGTKGIPKKQLNLELQRKGDADRKIDIT
jgi:hypothetical protein